ncbi:MAG: SDR family oxidoreductase [Rhodospirillaceae bacterium]|nr:SDR family oxidoreductase [Rhodospirillaceae bacterium]MBT6430740.1 SDR family oxidoreductase [Rhodospirillaceae bacterium]
MPLRRVIKSERREVLVDSFCSLEGRVAVITGPAKGMGAAATLMLAGAGADVVLVGRDLGPIEEVATDVRALGRRAEIVKCDVTSNSDVETMRDAVLKAFDRIDILVNIAGGTGPLGVHSWETTPEQFDQIIDINMKGCFLTMRALLPGMIAQRYGKIVNVGGTFGLRGRALRMAYSASKWGLRGITKSTALEVGPHNINVNCVCPGMVDGPRFQKVCAERAEKLGITIEEARAHHVEEYALRRISTDQDVANAILFFASDASQNITGQDLAIDGGWVI